MVAVYSMPTELQETKQELLQAIQLMIHTGLQTTKEELRGDIQTTQESLTGLKGDIQSMKTGLEKEIQDVLSAINSFSSDVDRRFDKIEGEIVGIKGEITGIKGEMSGMKNETAGLKSEVASLKATMVTKDYLDDKLSDLKGDLIVIARKQNRKFESLVEELASKGQLTRSVADRLLAMEPFPQ